MFIEKTKAMEVPQFTVNDLRPGDVFVFTDSIKVDDHVHLHVRNYASDGTDFFVVDLETGKVYDTVGWEDMKVRLVEHRLTVDV